MTPTHQPSTVLACLRAAVGPAADGPADAALLARFARDRDEGAFELLVWRHAAMVLAACRAVLRDHHAAEDACQATFLALARRAHAVGRRGTVAGWLHRVARRTAARAARRRPPRPADPADRLDRLPAPPATSGADADAVAALHDELDRLPEKYRAPVLLCFLGGLTYADAARRLGWPVGTVAGRVARAKDWLRDRLSGRGVGGPAAGVVGGVLAGVAPAAAVSPAFAAATARAGVAFAAGGRDVPGVSDPVLELARGVVRTMTMTKVRWAAGVLAACAGLAAGGVWAGGQVPDPGGPAAPPPGAGGPPPAAGGLVQPADRPATSAQRRRSLNNLKQIVLAIHNYEGVYGHLPTDIRDATGKAVLSWRVAILPFAEQQGLYARFRPDEPWDSEHNLKLLGQMPAVYRAGFEPADSTHTYYQGFAGSGTPFGLPRNGPGLPGLPGGPGGPPGGAGPVPGGPPGAGPAGGGGPGFPGRPRGIRITDITDGTSNTFGVVEAGPAVPWTKPADLRYDPKGPLPKAAWPFSNEIHVAMMDGSAHAFRRGIGEADLRRLIEMDDGHPVPDFKGLRAPTP
ncbi:MAG TPA: sigma-70 family RNA polymerase sigma factor, partial [Urbifossiella sp.]|nr:sigma-70 family RNA polymerase sigma factor [Urbifossiella sp.]